MIDMFIEVNPVQIFNCESSENFSELPNLHLNADERSDIEFAKCELTNFPGPEF